MSAFGAVIFHASPYMRDKHWALFKGERMLIVVPRGAPIEDVDYDRIVVSPSEYEWIKAQADQGSGTNA